MRGGKQILTALAAVGAITVAGCVQSSHGVDEAVSDEDMTYDDYDGVVSFGPAPGEQDAMPPIEIHQFDPDDVAAAGGVKVIDGGTWLHADDARRNALLLQAESQLPPDAVLVLVVATGEVWQIGDTGEALFTDGTLKPWSGDEYDDLSEYYLAPPSHGLTQGTFATLTAIASPAGQLANPSSSFGMPYFIHDLGPVGMKEIQSAHGFQIWGERQWTQASPVQRALELTAIDRYASHLPAFQGADNRPAYGVSIPQGNLYVVPQHNYDNLIGWGAVKIWTDEQIYGLPTVLTGPDRPIRDIKPVFTDSFKP